MSDGRRDRSDGAGEQAPSDTERYLRNFDHECGNCGYQLRGSKGDRCPECGTSLSLDHMIFDGGEPPSRPSTRRPRTRLSLDPGPVPAWFELLSLRWQVIVVAIVITLLVALPLALVLLARGCAR